MRALVFEGLASALRDTVREVLSVTSGAKVYG